MKVILKGGVDKTVIMAVREGVCQPFDAGAWLDLRVGFLLSICGDVDPTDDDTITSLGPETLTGPAVADHCFIGVRNNGTPFPGTPGVVFAGFVNGGSILPVTASKLISSDIGVGTSNMDYWRPTSGNIESTAGGHIGMWDGIQVRGGDNLGTLHMVQNFAGGHAAGYASLFMLRFQRPRSEIGAPITMTFKSGIASSDVLFTSTPTKALLQSNLESFPSSVYTIGPVTLSAVPDSLFWWWPFSQSRLRIHAAGILTVP